MTPTAIVTPARVRWAGLSLALAVVGAAFLTFAPMATSVTVQSGAGSVGGEGVETVTRSTHTLLQSEGVSVLPVLIVPILVALAGLAFARRSHTRALTLLTVLYGAGTVLALASVGVFFAPSLAALMLACRSAGRKDASDVPDFQVHPGGTAGVSGCRWAARCGRRRSFRGAGLNRWLAGRWHGRRSGR